MNKAADMRDRIRLAWLDGADLQTRLVDSMIDRIVYGAEMIVGSLERGGKLMLFGNPAVARRMRSISQRSLWAGSRS